MGAVYYGGGNDTDFLEGCDITNEISPFAPLNEMMYTVIENSESDFNAIMMRAGVRELAYVEENHMEMIYEDGKIKKLVDDVTGWFKKVWERIKEMINKALDAMTKKSVEFRKKILDKMNKDFLRKRLVNVASDKNFGTSYEYGDIGSKSASFLSSIGNADIKIIRIGEEAQKKSKNGETDTSGIETDLKVAMQSCFSGIGVKQNGIEFSQANYKKLLMSAMRGEPITVNGDKVKNNFNDWLDEVSSFPKTKRDLKKSYNEAKKSINEAIKKIHSYDTSKFFEASIFTKIVKYMKELRQITIVCEQCVISCVNEREAFYRSVIIKVIGTKPVKESADWDNDYFSESSTNDTVAAMFNW